ncbi:MAG TPA: transposase [Vicinamibacterales bacterium]|nr:transposase [Vicinamibacterales bacterium]
MARIYVPGLSVHVIRRGINRRDIFCDADDRITFLETLREAADNGRAAIHAYVLMSNHYHVLATPTDEQSLPTMMKALGEEYVRYFNRKYGRIGTLWTGRYRGLTIITERYWLNCLRYIEQNPVRAHIVKAPEDHPWSSYSTHGLGTRCEWLTEHQVYQGLGPNQRDRQAVYRSICNVPLSEEELRTVRRPPVPVIVALPAAPASELAVQV